MRCGWGVGRSQHAPGPGDGCVWRSGCVELLEVERTARPRPVSGYAVCFVKLYDPSGLVMKIELYSLFLFMIELISDYSIMNRPASEPILL